MSRQPSKMGVNETASWELRGTRNRDDKGDNRRLQFADVSPQGRGRRRRITGTPENRITMTPENRITNAAETRCLRSDKGDKRNRYKPATSIRRRSCQALGGTDACIGASDLAGIRQLGRGTSKALVLPLVLQ